MPENRSMDVMREVINIGIGEAASALSDLTDQRVMIKIPELKIMDSTDAAAYIQEQITSLGVYIAQDFAGEIKGKALLFYTRESSLELLKVLVGDQSEVSTLSGSMLETLQEIGNIILVSCISTISNMIEDGIRFEIPHVTVEISEGYFGRLVKGFGDLDQTIIVKNELEIQDTSISSYIFILLGFADFQLAVERMEKKLLT